MKKFKCSKLGLSKFLYSQSFSLFNCTGSALKNTVHNVR